MAEALRMARSHGATHAIIVTDGMPNNFHTAHRAARQGFSRVDGIYVGPCEGGGLPALRRICTGEVRNLCGGAGQQAQQMRSGIKDMMMAAIEE